MGVIVAAPTALDAFAGDDLPDDVRARIKAELAPGERLLWAGRPVRVLFGPMGWWSFGVWFLGGLVAAISGGAWLAVHPPTDTRRTPNALIVLAVGVVVDGAVLAGIWFNLCERRIERRRALRTLYAITDRRAIRWRRARSGRGEEVHALNARTIGGISRVEFEDGSGHVFFLGEIPPHHFTGLDGLADVRLVERLAREILVDPQYRGEILPFDETVKWRL